MINNRVYATPPVYVPMHSNQKDDLHSSWLNYFESLTQQLNQTLTPDGNLMPAVSTPDSTLIAASSEQKIIYNNTVNAFQGNVQGVWETFATVTIVNANELNEFAGTHENRIQLVYDTDNDEIYVVKGSNKFRLQKA